MKALSRSEKITLIFSIVSLMLSLVAFYFQFFYSSSKVLARIVDCKLDGYSNCDSFKGSHINDPNYKNKISLTASLVNCGNQPALIKTVYVVYARENGDWATLNGCRQGEIDSFHNFYNCRGGVTEMFKTTAVPAILKPGEILLVTASAPISSGYQYKAEENDQILIRVGLQFALMNFQGNLFDRHLTYADITFYRGTEQNCFHLSPKKVINLLN